MTAPMDTGLVESKWTPEQFWEYMEGLAGDWHAEQARGMLADCGLAIVSAAEIERLTRERNEARLLVTEANNSLFGSQGYFHSLNGGSFDKWHLARAIDELKSNRNRALTAEAQRDGAAAIVTAAKTYFNRYVQDEAAERECCISDQQHIDAQELESAIRAAAKKKDGGR